MQWSQYELKYSHQIIWALYYSSILVLYVNYLLIIFISEKISKYSVETSWTLKGYQEALYGSIWRRASIWAYVLVILGLLDVFQLSQVLFDRSPSFCMRREWVEWTWTGCRCSFLSIISFDVSHFKSIRKYIRPPAPQKGMRHHLCLTLISLLALLLRKLHFNVFRVKKTSLDKEWRRKH